MAEARPSRTRRGSKPGPPRRAPQQRGRAARTRILASAEHLFARSGYAGVSLDAIGERAGMSKQRILHHYPTKRALYEAVVDTILESLTGTLALAARAGDAAGALAALEVWIDQLAARPSIASLILYEVASPAASAQPRAFTPFARRITDEFEALVHRIAPHAHPDDAFHVSSTLAGTTLFYATAAHERAAGRSPRAAERSVERHKELLLGTARSLLAAISKNSAPPANPGSNLDP